MLLRHTSRRLLLSLALAVAPLAAQAEAKIDQPAPTFTAQGADGKPVKLDAYKGKTVVLEWTNADCPFVKKHYESGNIPKLQSEEVAKGVVWLQVISSAPGEQGNVDGATALKLNDYRGAKPSGTVLDPQGTLGKLYGAQTTPHFFVIDPTGKLVYKGAIDSIASVDQGDIHRADNYVKAALDSVQAGKKVERSVTKPYGCSVKYTG